LEVTLKTVEFKKRILRDSSKFPANSKNPKKMPGFGEFETLQDHIGELKFAINFIQSIIV